MLILLLFVCFIVFIIFLYDYCMYHETNEERRKMFDYEYQQKREKEIGFWKSFFRHIMGKGNKD